MSLRRVMCWCACVLVFFAVAVGCGAGLNVVGVRVGCGRLVGGTGVGLGTAFVDVLVGGAGVIVGVAVAVVVGVALGGSGVWVKDAVGSGVLLGSSVGAAPTTDCAVSVAALVSVSGVGVAVALAVAAKAGGQLREALRSRLPRYMMPSLMVWLPVLPLTVNGQVDTSALSPPLVAEPVAGSGPKDLPSPPGEPTIEDQVEQIWADVIGVRTVRRGENFFDAGARRCMRSTSSAGCSTGSSWRIWP